MSATTRSTLAAAVLAVPVLAQIAWPARLDVTGGHVLFAASQLKSAGVPLSHACAAVESRASKPKKPWRAQDSIVIVLSPLRARADQRSR